jgi:hypothetical protein
MMHGQTQIMSKALFIIRRPERYIQKASCKVQIIFQVLMICGFSGQTFKRYPKFHFHENLFSWSRVVSCGRKDMTKQIIAFRTFAKAPKKQLKKRNRGWNKNKK